MSSQVAASPEAMLKLAGNIGENIKKIVLYNSELSRKLDSLGDTFHDEGFDIIREHIRLTRNKMQESLPEFRVFLGRLVEIANAYKKSEQAIEDKDGLNWAGRMLAIPAVAVGLGIAATDVSASSGPAANNLLTTQQIMTYNEGGTNISKPVVNNLKKTRQKWIYHADGSRTYNSPEETGKTLNYDQGNAIKGFKGTCGVVSSGNVLTMAGVKVSEKELVEYCSKNLSRFGEPLCTIDDEPENNGGTDSLDRQQILEHYGVQSMRHQQTIENIATAVEAGRGVIISVDVKELWQSKQEGFHAITVTSVKRDKNGDIEGFWVTDSGTGKREPATYYKKDVISKSLTDSMMNVTINIIR
jgi:hypothetical protein